MKSAGSFLYFQPKKSTVWRDWSSLPPELLELILQILVYNFVDEIRFKTVCKSWHFISLKNPPNPPLQLPWLMLSSYKTITTPHSFFSLSDTRRYTLPVLNSRSDSCSGSSHGWLFMEESFKSCSVLNPVTRVRIMLPLLRSLVPPGIIFNAMFNKLYKANQGKLIVKGVLSCCPYSNSNDVCWVVLIVGHRNPRLSVCKLGQDTWSLISGGKSYVDVMYFKGQFYAVDCDGRIVVCDLGSSFPVVSEIGGPKPFRADKTYLVELLGELLLVRRFRGWSFDLEMVHKTVMFKILKQDQVSKEWVEVKTLGRRSLFLGHNHSLSVLASDYGGCKENCIYFTDNCFRDYAVEKAEPHDVGIFSLANGCVEPLPGYSYDEQFIGHPPVWITPCPW